MLICFVNVVVLGYNKFIVKTLVILTIYWVFTNKKKNLKKIYLTKILERDIACSIDNEI